MKFVTNTLARVLFVLPFFVSGIMHLLNANAMAGMVPIPGGAFWVYFTGVAMLLASIGIVTGFLGRWAAFGLAALLVLYVVTIHAPQLGDPQRGQMAMINLLKDLGLCGGALTWAGLLGTSLRTRGEGHFVGMPRRPASAH